MRKKENGTDIDSERALSLMYPLTMSMFGLESN